MGVEELEQLLSRSRQLLGAVRRGEPEPESEPVVAIREAADGLIRVVASDGHIERIELVPRAMRLDSQTLGEELTRAVNAALADLRTASGSARGADLEVLDRQLSEVQDEGLRRMADIAAAVQTVMGRIHQERR